MILEFCDPTPLMCAFKSYNASVLYLDWDGYDYISLRPNEVEILPPLHLLLVVYTLDRTIHIFPLALTLSSDLEYFLRIQRLRTFVLPASLVSWISLTLMKSVIPPNLGLMKTSTSHTLLAFHGFQ
jgi:hypothetical protein